MNDMERRKFEDSFQDAFKDAEASPSGNVWTNIELDLERAEGGKMKRRLLFFKTLAAASITFAVFMAAIGYYLLNDQTQSNNLAHDVRSGDAGKGVVSNESEARNIENEKQQGENVTRPDNASKLGDALTGNKKETSATDNKNDRALEAQGKDFGSVTHASDGEKQDSKLSGHEVDIKHHGDKNTLSSGIQSVESNNKSPQAANSSVTDNRGSTQNFENNATKLDEERIQLAKSYTPGAAGVEHFTPKTTGGDETVVSGGGAPLHSPTTSGKLPSFYQPKNPELQLPVSKADPGVLLLARLADEERSYVLEDKKRQKDKSEKLWTSVGFAAGGFNSPNPSVSPSALSNLSTTSSNVATKQSKASGLAYAVGVSIGANLSDRWVLQGGVNYLTQSSDYTANNVIVADNNFLDIQAESINAYNDPKLAGGSSQSRVAQTFPYNVNNNVQFVSVPVQAGYMVLNKKLGFQVNAGISTDLFLQNTITPEGGGLTKTTQSRGDDSPYRSLNFSGLMGTELSYKLGYRYRLSLNPGLRYPLNSVYKSDTGVQATPLTFDIGLRFRYIFH